MTNEELQRKLKRERVEMCLKCNHFVECESIGQYEPCHCEEFVEVEDSRQCVIVSLGEYARLKDG
jgi:hypothetical protein